MTTAVPSKDGIYHPPLLPPPFLSEAQVEHLAEQGWLELDALPERLTRLLSDLDAAVTEFFKLSQQAKQVVYPASNGTERGYYVAEGEKEYVTLRCASDSRTPPLKADLRQSSDCEHTDDTASALKQRKELEEMAANTWSCVAGLLHRCLVDLSWALGLDPHLWEPFLDGCLTLPSKWADSTPTLLRMFQYEPHKGVAGRHSDNGLLTLCVGTRDGLQVLDLKTEGPEPIDSSADQNGAPVPGGTWYTPRRPSLLIGDTLRMLTLNRVKSGIHRVIANSEGRRSTVFALRASTRRSFDLTPFILGAGKTVTEEEIKTQAYVVDGHEIWSFVTTGKININAKQEVRAQMERSWEERKKRALEAHESTAKDGVADARDVPSTAGSPGDNLGKGHEAGTG